MTPERLARQVSKAHKWGTLRLCPGLSHWCEEQVFGYSDRVLNGVHLGIFNLLTRRPSERKQQ